MCQVWMRWKAPMKPANLSVDRDVKENHSKWFWWERTLVDGCRESICKKQTSKWLLFSWSSPADWVAPATGSSWGNGAKWEPSLGQKCFCSSLSQIQAAIGCSTPSWGDALRPMQGEKQSLWQHVTPLPSATSPWWKRQSCELDFNRPHWNWKGSACGTPVWPAGPGH